MKRIVFMLAMLAGSTSQAQSDFSVTWRILGGLQIGPRIYTRVELDINVGTRYYTANGALLDDFNFASPAVGTCFDSSGSIFCSLQVDQNTYSMTIAPTLSGTLSGKDSIGAVISSSALQFVSAE